MSDLDIAGCTHFEHRPASDKNDPSDLSAGFVPSVFVVSYNHNLATLFSQDIVEIDFPIFVFVLLNAVCSLLSISFLVPAVQFLL